MDRRFRYDDGDAWLDGEMVGLRWVLRRLVL